MRRFYKDRHHTKVLRTIRKVERLWAADESVDRLLEMLTRRVEPRGDKPNRQRVWGPSDGPPSLRLLRCKGWTALQNFQEQETIRLSGLEIVNSKLNLVHKL